YSEIDREPAMLLPRTLSILRLLSRLSDPDLDRKHLASAAVAGAPHRRGTEIVERHRDPNLGFGGSNPVGHVERHPAELGHVGFGPGVTGVLLACAIVAAKIAGDATRRNVEAAGGRNEDMGEVVSGAALERKGLCGGGRSLAGV